MKGRHQQEPARRAGLSLPWLIPQVDPSMIQVQNLTKSFRDLRRGQVLAVDHISFEARPGEVLALLGPNGAGKTTTMRILCTVLRPSGGLARICGYDVASQPADVRR